MKKTITTMLAAATFLLAASPARADETTCVAGREQAAGKYAACQSKMKVTFQTDFDKVLAAATECRIKYAATWEKLKAKNPGTTCDTAARFVDNGNNTVTDNLTGLVWEKKTTTPGSGANPSDRHDVDNSYTWTNGDADATDGDGTAFTDLLADLNSGGGFAGANGWRLPTIQELQTILLPETYPCATTSCVVSELGSDAAANYFSASTLTEFPTTAWYVDTNVGSINRHTKTFAFFARAVRSGS